MRSTRTGHRKSGLMARLRRLRSFSSLQPEATAHAPDKPPPYTAQQPPTSGRTGRKWAPDTKPQATTTTHGDQPLDLAKLDSKLEQWAKVRSRDEDDDDEGDQRHDTRQDDPEKEDKDTLLAPQRTDGGKAVAETIENRETSQVLVDPTAIPLHPHHQSPSEAPEADIDATQQPSTESKEDDTQPSDFDVFLQKAHEEERLRRERGGATGRLASTGTRTSQPKREPPLNPFYGNNLGNWADRNVGDDGDDEALPPNSNPKAKPKLTEIRESDDKEEEEEKEEEKEEEGLGTAQQGLSTATASSLLSSSSTASSGSHDFADPTSLQYNPSSSAHAHAQPSRRVGRHVSFTEPPTTIIPSHHMRERSASYPVVPTMQQQQQQQQARGRMQGRLGSPRGGTRRRQQRSGSRRKGGMGIGRIFAGFGR